MCIAVDRSDDQDMQDVYVCIDGDAARTLEQLDKDFCGFFEVDKPEQIFIPAVIGGDVLCRCGYFSAFPDQILSLSAIGEDQMKTVAETGTVRPDQFSPQALYLTPAACLHFYPLLARRETISPMTLTARARVFRREVKGVAPLTRLWDFTVREFVFVGGEAHVRARLEHARDTAFAYAQKLFTDVSLEIASDHFYPTPMNRVKARLQRGNARKFEIVARFGERQIALASFNYHDLHFSGAFSFDQDKTLVTGCAGFGLERWIGAMALEAETAV